MVKGCICGRACCSQADTCPYLPPRDGTGPSCLKSEMSRLLRRESFYLWMFIAQEGLLEEARVFMEENTGHPVPSEYGTLP